MIPTQVIEFLGMEIDSKTNVIDSNVMSIDSKEQKLIMPLVVILKLDMEFHRGRFWVPYFLISISATYFLTKSNAISQVMRTITHHIILVLI